MTLAGVSPLRGQTPLRLRASPRLRALVRADHGREARDLLALTEPHHDHALRRAARALDPVGRHPDHGAAVRDEHHLVAVAHDAGAGEPSLRLDQLDGLDAHRAATLDRVLGDARALAPAVLGHDEEVGVVGGDVDLDHLVVSAELHPGDAGGRSAHRANVLLREPHRLPETRDHEDVVLAVREPDTDELVVLAHPQGDDPVRLERRVVLEEGRLLDDSLLRREDEVLGLLEVAGRDDGADQLSLPEREQVDDRAALCLARAERKLVHLEAVDLADGREEEDVVVRRGDEQVLDVVVVLHVHAHHADPAAALLPVARHRAGA